MTRRKESVSQKAKRKQIQHEYLKYLKISKEVKPLKETIKIIFIYIVLGVLWILVSDKIVSKIFLDPNVVAKIQLLKGWFYVIASGGVFFFFIYRAMNLFKKSNNEILKGYEELSLAHEELMAMEEELNQQNNELVAQKHALTLSEQRYHLAIEGSNDGIWDWDINNNHFFFSIKNKKTLGYQENELNDTFDTWKNLLHPDDRMQATEELLDYINQGSGIYESVYRLRCKDGSYKWILSRGKAVWEDNGDANRVAGSHTDITDQILLQERYRQEKELSDSIIRGASLLIVVLNQEGQIIRFNPFAENLTGYNEEELVGKSIIGKILPKDTSVQEFVTTPIKNQERSIFCKDGHSITILWNSNILHDEDGNVLGIVAIGVDISERRKMERQLHDLAYHDRLTGLPNRTMFEEYMAQLLYYSAEIKRYFAMIYIDIDNFKHINDSMGHRAGDKLIVDVANIIKMQFEKPNMVARLSGDEFVIIINDVKNVDFIREQLNELLTKIRTPWVYNNQDFFVSVSMGIALFPEDGRDLSTLLQNADTAMFHKKENGKDGYSFYNKEMRELTLNYIQLSSQLRLAIYNNEFDLYYQPQFSLETGELVGVEALIRWIHPEKGLISPNNFIPLAEKTGYIKEIDEWVLKTACAQKKQWEERFGQSIHMSINVSSKRLTDHHFIENMSKCILEEDITCSGIELEITETAIIENIDIALSAIQQLKEFGFKIALDDFGTGYSSLTYLQRLPIDTLKIDRSFTQKITNQEEQHFLITSLIQLAHDLNIDVVAEGIETKEQLVFLRKNECDIGQGYYYSKPVPSDEMENLIKGNLK